LTSLSPRRRRRSYEWLASAAETEIKAELDTIMAFHMEVTHPGRRICIGGSLWAVTVAIN